MIHVHAAVVRSTKSAAVRTNLNEVRAGVVDMLHRFFLHSNGGDGNV